LLVVANPDVKPLNQSAMVGKLVRYLGAPFGGSAIEFSNTLDFANHPVITMKVWTSAPIGTYVTLKAEKPFWGEERSVQTTKSGEWEMLSFDFTNAPTDLNKLAFLFDFTAGSTNVGNGGASSTFYFDEVKFANVALSSETPSETSSFGVFPNPSEGDWTISSPEGQTFHVLLYDLHGRLLLDLTSSDSQPLRIDSRPFSSGVYVARIRSALGIQELKLIKK
jgi:hypothetical protein